MAELVEISDLETRTTFHVTFGYEDYMLTVEAAQALRDALDEFLRK
jgi:hypothetical protein